MPLRDHFHSPAAPVGWDGVHGQWPAMIVLDLFSKLPKGYLASPCHHRGKNSEDVLSSYDECDVQISAPGRGVRAVVSLVTPANKKRAEHRQMRIAGWAAHLNRGVSVILVDVVTVRPNNLYSELLHLLGVTDPTLVPEPAQLYAVACRPTKGVGRDRLDAWFHPLAIGQPLPTLPLWLDDDLAVPLDLETTYEETCRVLHLA